MKNISYIRMEFTDNKEELIKKIDKLMPYKKLSIIRLHLEYGRFK